MLVAALGRLGPQVSIVNLSLGGFTQDDLPPLPLVNAAGRAAGADAVVAAAGNAGTSRPAWPAALDRVLAVAAVSRVGTGLGAGAVQQLRAVGGRLRLGEPDQHLRRGPTAAAGPADPVFHGFAAWSGTSFATATSPAGWPP